jgi:hypothetical protein
LDYKQKLRRMAEQSRRRGGTLTVEQIFNLMDGEMDLKELTDQQLREIAFSGEPDLSGCTDEQLERIAAGEPWEEVLGES